jgi:hypothetical protein
MILMKAADDPGECFVRASELTCLHVCVFAGHHCTFPFKVWFQIHYVLYYLFKPLAKNRCVDFPARVDSDEDNPGIMTETGRRPASRAKTGHLSSAHNEVSAVGRAEQELRDTQALMRRISTHLDVLSSGLN